MRNCQFSPLPLVFLSAFLIAPAASAGPKEDVAAATNKWADMLAENKPESILPLYAEDAVC